MDRYARHHLADSSLLSSADRHAGCERGSTADLIADLAEIEARKLHLKQGHGSMLAWCVAVLRLSEPSALRRINVARVARRFPVIFEMVADGRLTLTTALVLSPFLFPETADDLLLAASGRSKLEVQHLLAQRFLRPWLGSEMSRRLAPERVEDEWRARETPVAPEVWELLVRYGQTTHDKLAYLRDLLSHQIPSGSIAEVLDRALEVAIRQAEKQKFSATDRPRGAKSVNHESGATDAHKIPAHVRQAVWQRDGGGCTYVSPEGRRCGSRWQVEFDHREAVATGGEATVDNVRLLCRAHNQYMAECTFGPGFMREKRKEADAARKTESRCELGVSSASGEVIPYLRKLRFSLEEARERAKLCEAIPNASLEERVKVALSGRLPPCRTAA